MLNISLNLGAKVLIGVGAAVAGWVIVKKITEKQEATTEEEVIAKACGEDETTVKEKIAEKAVEGLTWVTDHEKEFKGFCTLLGTAAAVISVANGIRQFGMKNKIYKELNSIRLSMFNYGYNECLRETERTLRETLADKENPIFEIWDKNDIPTLKVKLSPVEAA